MDLWHFYDGNDKCPSDRSKSHSDLANHQIVKLIISHICDSLPPNFVFQLRVLSMTNLMVGLSLIEVRFDWMLIRSDRGTIILNSLGFYRSG